MKANIRGFLMLALSLFVSACGHIHEIEKNEQIEKPGTEVGIQVGIGSDELKAGDTVIVKKSVCVKKYRGRSGFRNECSYKKVGEALVLRVIDENSSVVRPDPGVTIDKSSRMEKK